jgi:hypothetical protein
MAAFEKSAGCAEATVYDDVHECQCNDAQWYVPVGTVSFAKYNWTLFSSPFILNLLSKFIPFSFSVTTNVNIRPVQVAVVVNRIHRKSRNSIQRALLSRLRQVE